VKAYRAIAERSGKWWAIQIPEVRGCHSQARRLSQVEPMAREAIALLLGVPESEVAVTVELRLPDELAAEVGAVERAKRETQAAMERERAAVAHAARALTQANLTHREAGEVLHLSHSRIHQVLSDRR
jgi:predicted RNase H-like HicB family nuclease